jgi:hypothetical protein
MAETPTLTAKVDFDCLEEGCNTTIQFNLMALAQNQGQVACPNCHRPYQFDRAFLKQLEKLRALVFAVRDAQDILGSCNIAITTPAGEVKIPYQLLLTRLNTMVTLNVGGHQMDFNFRVEPLQDGTFR